MQTSSHPLSEARLQDPLVAAVLEVGLPVSLNLGAAQAHVVRCEAALGLLGPHDSLEHVMVLSSQAVAMAQSDDTRLESCARAAMEMAARLDDEVARGYALVARSMAMPMPDEAEERLSHAREVLDIAAEHLEPALVPIAHVILMVALLELGRVRDLDLELTGRSPSAVRFLSQHRTEPVGWFRCLRMILDGDTEAAQALAEEQLAAATREDSDALGIYTSQMGMIRWMRGGIDGVEEGFAAARRLHPEQALWPASLAWLWLGQGRRTAAESLFATLQDLDAIPRDRYRLPALTTLAELAIHLGSRSFAEEVRACLLPFAGYLVPIGAGVSFWGTCVRSLGLLEERLGMLAEAREHLELAVELTRRVGAQAWLAEAQIDLAEFAIRHDLGDIDAYGLLAEARATCAALGFEALHRRTVQRPRIRVLGRFEVIDMEGQAATWNSRKARDLLKVLVSARGTAVSREVLMDALWPGMEPVQLANRFSVAVSVVRRALDPQRLVPVQHHLVVEGDGVRLDLDTVDVDLERFHALARRPDDASRASARALYDGGPFPDEPYADWSIQAREEAERAWTALG